MHDDATTIKIFFNSIVIGVSCIFAYAGLSSDQMIAYAVLIGIDYITGLGKAWHIGQRITSNRMKYGIVSKASLLLVPVALGIGANATEIDFGMAINMFINMLIISEVYSIISNVYAIRNGKELPEYDVLAIVARHVREYLIKKGE
jgi:phage-related holin